MASVIVHLELVLGRGIIARQGIEFKLTALAKIKKLVLNIIRAKGW
mgnify:CR=1 FL=1